MSDTKIPVMIPTGSQIPVQFIKCTEEDIRKMKVKFDEGTNINLNLNLDKEPEEDPIEKLIKELESISI